MKTSFKKNKNKNKKKTNGASSEREKREYISEIERDSLRALETAKKTDEELNEYYQTILEGTHSESETRAKIDSFKRATSNFTKALRQSARMSDELSARWKDAQNQNKKKHLISNAPANATIDINENRTDHFAKGINIYKLLLICFIGSFIGVVIEMLWCLITNGYIESRAGLVWGPFNLLYGVGAVVMSACLYRYRNRGNWISFIGGFTVGCVVEYVCSWLQELVFGSRSWDYSHLPFNINGRICLMYSVFWGVLGVVWIKDIYPRISKLILKIPNRIGKISTWVLTVFFVLNAAVSCISVYRWTERMDGIEPQNVFWEFVDERFPDERMEKIFANMEFNDGE